MSLTEQLNQGEQKVQGIEYVDLYKVYQGPIPLTIPAIKQDRRTIADGNYILQKRLRELQLQSEQKPWCYNYLDTPDLCAILDDLVKLQPNSPFLTGIQGIIDNQIAVSADVLASGVKDMQLFPVTESATVTYLKDGEENQHPVNNVILLPYNGISMALTPEQFQAINAEEFKRENVIHNRGMKQEEIVKDGRVIHPVWKIYSPEIVIPYVNEVFKHNKGYNANMGFWLPSQSDQAQLRALYLDGLGNRSRLNGYGGLGDDYAQLVGVVENVAEGDAPKI